MSHSLKFLRAFFDELGGRLAPVKEGIHPESSYTPAELDAFVEAGYQLEWIAGPTNLLIGLDHSEASILDMKSMVKHFGQAQFATVVLTTRDGVSYLVLTKPPEFSMSRCRATWLSLRFLTQGSRIPIEGIEIGNLTPKK